MLAPLSFLVVLLAHSAHSPCRVHTTAIYCAQYQRPIFTACVCLSLHAVACLLDCQSRGQSSPASRSSARARYQHIPSTPHPSDHQSPITHSLTHHSLFSSSTKQHTHTHTIRTYLRTTIHTSIHHCLSLALVTHAYTPLQSIHHPTACTRLCRHDAALRPPQYPPALLVNTLDSPNSATRNRLIASYSLSALAKAIPSTARYTHNNPAITSATSIPPHILTTQPG